MEASLMVILQAWKHLREWDPRVGSRYSVQYSLMLGGDFDVVSPISFFGSALPVRCPTQLHGLLASSFLAYGAFKILQLFFFTERIYLVYTSEPGVSAPRRCQSKWYRASAVLMTLWWAGGMSTLVSRFAYRSTSDSTCIIGARQYGAIIIIILQGIVNLYFTGAFLLALRGAWLKNRVGRRLAISSALAEMVGLVVSAANILGIALSEKGQESWICLLSCGLDLFINACVAFFITSPPPFSPPPSPSGFISNFGSSHPVPPVVPLVGVGFASSDRESSSTFTAVEEKEVAVAVVESRSPAEKYAREWGWEGKEKSEGEGEEKV
ncbi:hypothetical protein BCR35DRAFT_352340 [Leucosporidium creatinivorum]|uniref:Transmembrane protein n=1 Tax=Leucosporidium creatinivorum TaxID=106004 RepID=A0A1Y2FEK6_9BASI|nr:hypothetical protein BCR35DRAFT_352340 [Leucosporidium creatinivorum]